MELVLLRHHQVDQRLVVRRTISVVVEQLRHHIRHVVTLGSVGRADGPRGVRQRAPAPRDYQPPSSPLLGFSYELPQLFCSTRQF